MKRLTDDGALFIGRIKSYIIEEKQIIPTGLTQGRRRATNRLPLPLPQGEGENFAGCYSAAALTVSTAS